MNAQDESQLPDLPSDSPTEEKKGSCVLSLFTLSVSAVVLALVSGFIIWPRASAYVKRLQAHDLVRKADAAVTAEDWRTASENYTKAFMKMPFDPLVLRGIGKFMNKTGADPERTLFIWRQLSRDAQFSHEDAISMAETYLRLNKPAEARHLLSRLPEAVKETSRSLEVEANLLNMEGRQAEAVRTMRRAVLAGPDIPENRFKLARLDLSNPLSEVQSAAVNTLWELARGDSKISLGAIEVLARDTRLTQAEFQDLLAILSKREDTTETHRYNILNHMLKRFPELKTRILDEEKDRLAGSPPDKLVPYLLLLQALEAHERILQMLPEDRILKLRDFFVLYSEAMANTGQWAKLRSDMLQAPSLPISQAEHAILRARISRALGESSEVVRGHLLEAARHATAARDINHVKRISDIAESFGYPEAAVETLRTGASLPQHRISLLETILNIQSRQQDSEGMLKTLADLVETDPELHYHQQKLFYLKLLVGAELETTPDKIDRLAKQTLITSGDHQLLTALAAFRRQDVEAVRTALSDLEPEQFQPGQRAVLSGLLNVSGDPARGFRIAEKVPANLLLNEERKFLFRAL